MTLPAETATKAGPGELALEWWRRWLSPDRGDPGVRARLRRSRSVTEALTIPAAVGLARRLGAVREGAHPQRLEQTLRLAQVLAHVRAHRPVSAMRALGYQSFPGDKPSETPKLSEARFRRLLKAEEGEEQVTMFIRLVHLLGGETDIAALARDFLFWHRESTRQRWAFEYYAAGVAAPASADHAPGDPA
jgi:CRISPR system Cascade subunit CasB